MSDVERMVQLDEFLREVRPSGILDDAFTGSNPDPVRPLPNDVELDHVMADFEARQQLVRESRPSELIQLLERRQRHGSDDDHDDDDDDDDDEKDKIIRVLLGYIHVSET
jgi:hypothetical protein